MSARGAATLNLKPEMASYTPGSVNLGPIVYQNDQKLTNDMAKIFCDTGIKPQVEVFDTNMISNAYNLVDRGLLKQPIDFGFVMGAPNAQECSLRQLGHLLAMLRPGDTWTSIGIGKFRCLSPIRPLRWAAMSVSGLEDNNKTPDGKVARNADLVRHVVEMAKMMGREIATPEEAREILSMPAENADWILDNLDPKVPLETFVSGLGPIQGVGAGRWRLAGVPAEAAGGGPGLSEVNMRARGLGWEGAFAWTSVRRCRKCALPEIANCT